MSIAITGAAVELKAEPTGDGFTITIGRESVVLDEAGANKLGRYLLFTDDSDASTPYPEVSGSEPTPEEPTA